MKKLIAMTMFAMAFAAGCASTPAPRAVSAETHAADDFGVLVMAHGGGPTWNREVEAALAPLRQDYPLEIAFGMADATSLQEGVSRLEAQGVRRIGVVRLFISGESWYERTAQILGLAPGAPPKSGHDTHAGHGDHGGHSMAFFAVDSDARFALSQEGLMDAPEMGLVLAGRVRALSRAPREESVLILAHGPGDDDEDRRWLARIDARAQAVRDALPFRRVQVETLREDWPEKREAAERRVRRFVEEAGRDSGRAIVIPYRVQGFGPYAKVLEGLDYVSDGQGLVPSPQVRLWVQRQAEALRSRELRRGR